MIDKLILFIKRRILSVLPLRTQAKLNGVKLGKSNFIASNFWSTEPYLISIGNNCQITEGVRFFTHGGGGAIRKEFPKFDCFGKIEIGDFVYIGTNSLIMPGVTIGNNVLIAAGSVVVNSIPENVVVGGNPARIISSLDEYVKRNLPFNLNTKGLSKSEKMKLIMASDSSLFIKKRFLKS